MGLFFSQNTHIRKKGLLYIPPYTPPVDPPNDEDYLETATYYVSSSSGNDSNNGTTPETAWATLSKVNSQSFSAGDVIGFKAGDIFEGTLSISSSGASGNTITFGTYGSGAKAQILGSEIITGWTVHSGNIYKASFNSNIDQLFVDGSMMKLARYPNSGYTTDSYSTDWNGATCIARNTAYSLSHSTVSGSGDLIGSNGYILTNKLSFLDTPGEWFYDTSTNTVYLWMSDSSNPSTVTVRGSTINNGVDIQSKSYVKLQDISIEQFNNAGINGNNSSNIIIDNCDIQGEQYGIYNIGTSSNITITNCNIHHCNRTGIWSYAEDQIITDNYIHDIGLRENWHKVASGQQYGTAIFTRGDDCIINYNHIENVGYDGINFWGKRTMVKYNFVDTAMKSLGDGGGIYCYNGAAYTVPAVNNSEVMYNIVLNCRGDRSGWSNNYDNGYGIYMDNTVADVTIQYNTVHNANCGIYLHDASNIDVRYNDLSDCGVMLIQMDESTISYIRNNIFYAFDELDDFIWWQNGPQRFMHEASGASGTWDYNTYVQHYSNSVVFGSTSNWATWRSTGKDPNSTFDDSSLSSGELGVLFYNKEKTEQLQNLSGYTWRDLDGNTINSLTLQPFTSKILIRE